jgi:prostaglandin reductase 1
MSKGLINMLARKFVLKRPFEGLPKISDFELVEEKLSDQLNDGEILAKAEWLTVDPYMRLFATPGQTMIGGQVARVLKSRNPEYPEGTQIYGNFGWRTLTIYKPVPNGPRNYQTMYKLPDMKGLPASYALGVVGMPGNTGYFGLLEICQPKAGETLVVTAAAGAVGSLVGQIGKIKGCRVIGFAGSDDKVQWLKQLGFDVAVNYKKVSDLDAVFKEHAPNGIDCYFDNVGNEYTYHVMRNMNEGGRIAACGSISSYNSSDPSGIPMVPFDYPSLRMRGVRLEGFHVLKWDKRWFEGLNQIRDWIVEGKIKVQETVTEGFENMPQAFIDVLEGRNTGKAVIKV